jgi:hypothetical protein
MVLPCAPKPERRCDIDWLRLLAGAATWFAIGFRSGGQYVRERFTRLLVPFGMKPLRPRGS